MKDVFFKPWVGKHYKQGYKNKRILVLGDSHYCGDGCDGCGDLQNSYDKCPELTIEVVKKFLSYKKGNKDHDSWMTTYTRFTNIFKGEKVDNQDVIDFWNSIIFYNYVQSSVKGSRIPPTFKQYDESKDPFFEIISEYLPDLIIVWGKRLWENLPDNGECGNETILDGKYGKFYYYNVKSKKIPSFCVYHPSSSYFNYDYSRYFDEIFRILNIQK